MKPIWIVDDDQSIRFVLEKALAREQLPVRAFSNPRDVLTALNDGDEPQVLVSDIRMPGGSGLDLLTKIKERQPLLPVIIMTAFSDLDSAVSAFQGGAFEYLPKPFDLPRAVELIRRAVDESQREQVAEDRMADAPEMLGQAPAMQDVFRAIGRLSQSHVTVLITGESGSGKTVTALSATVGGAQVTGTASIDRSGARGVYSARLHAGTLPLDRFVPVGATAAAPRRTCRVWERADRKHRKAMSVGRRRACHARVVDGSSRRATRIASMRLRTPSLR